MITTVTQWGTAQWYRGKHMWRRPLRILYPAQQWLYEAPTNLETNTETAGEFNSFKGEVQCEMSVSAPKMMTEMLDWNLTNILRATGKCILLFIVYFIKYIATWFQLEKNAFCVITTFISRGHKNLQNLVYILKSTKQCFDFVRETAHKWFTFTWLPVHIKLG